MISPTFTSYNNIGYFKDFCLSRDGQFVFGEGRNTLDASVSSANYQIYFALHCRTSLINKVVFLNYVI